MEIHDQVIHETISDGSEGSSLELKDRKRKALTLYQRPSNAMSINNGFESAYSSTVNA